MKSKILNTISNALKSMDYPLVNISIEKPKNKENGDISSNIAFLLSKELKQKPLDIANKCATESF